MKVPTEHPGGNPTDWQKFAGGSGKTDVGVKLAFAKRVHAIQLLADVGFKKAGSPSEGLRIQFVDSSKVGIAGFVVGEPVTVPLQLHNQLTFTTGTSLPAFAINRHQFWLIAEFSYTHYVGDGIPVERLL